MIAPLYIITLGLAAGLTGIAGHRFVSAYGFAPDFHSSLMLTGCLASGYLTVQLFYVAAVRFIKPSKGPVFYLAEMLSQASALVLLPYLLRLSVPWPHPSLQKAELLIFLGVFAALHGFFKLVSFFSAIRGIRGNSLGALGWFAATAVCACAAGGCYQVWNATLLEASTAVPGPAQWHTAGSVYAPARSIPEHIRFTFAIAPHSGKNLLFRWASPPGLEEPIERIAMVVSFDTAISLAKQHTITLTKNNWTRCPIIPIPGNATQCTVFWSLETIPDWLLQTGFTPLGGSEQRMLLSGPCFLADEKSSDRPSFVVVAADGLGAEHVSALNYDRDTTPALKSFSTRAHTFESAYCPAPETLATLTTLLTGVHPLAHGQLGRHHGPLPNGIHTLPEMLREQGYATAAFTEGAHPDNEDLIADSPAALGIDYLDTEFAFENPERRLPSASADERIPAGPQTTLEKAVRWLNEHQDVKTFTLVRLRHLAITEYPASDALNAYDTAIINLDRALGAFLDQLDTLPQSDHLCIVITGTYGLDFSGIGLTNDSKVKNSRYLTETSLHVPLFLLVPGESPRRRVDVVSMEDLPPTLLNLAKTSFPHSITGTNLSDLSAVREPISVMGNPLALSLRTRKWRFTWQSGRDPFTHAVTGPSEILALIDMDLYRLGRPQLDTLTRYTSTISLLQDRLKEFIETQPLLPETPSQSIFEEK